MNREGALCGMIRGITVTAAYIIYYGFLRPDLNNADYWLWGISPGGFGTLGMALYVTVAVTVALRAREGESDVLSKMRFRVS